MCVCVCVCVCARTRTLIGTIQVGMKFPIGTIQYTDRNNTFRRFLIHSGYLFNGQYVIVDTISFIVYLFDRDGGALFLPVARCGFSFVFTLLCLVCFLLNDSTTVKIKGYPSLGYLVHKVLDKEVSLLAVEK